MLKSITESQRGYLIQTVDDIISSLPMRAINQILEGYQGDVDYMLSDMLE